jgi:surface-anchored protein
VIGARQLLAIPAVVAALAAPAAAGTITSGHLDLDLDYSGGAGGAMSLDWRTYNPMSAGTPVNTDDYAVSGNPARVPIANTYTVPAGASWACLGTAGSTVYRLKQSQDASQVWLGWNTQDVPAATFVGDKVDLQLVGVVSAPVNGRFVLYTTNAFGTPTYLLNSTAGGCSKPTLAVTTNIHAHGWWAFTAPGVYVLRFEAVGTLVAGLGGGTKTSGTVDVTFRVE